MNKFQKAEYANAAKYFGINGYPVETKYPYILERGYSSLNLHPHYADEIETSFRDQGVDGDQAIQWHTHANHGASSQVCCVNFLYPIAHNAEQLREWIGHVTGFKNVAPRIMETLNNKESYIAFEWFPAGNLINEADSKGKLTRGSNSTSVDAACCFTHRGKTHLLLIEWKYTEIYGAARNANPGVLKDGADEPTGGDSTRRKRYGDIWQMPNGPIRSDYSCGLEPFFLNPWYQLLRQQVLAFQCERSDSHGNEKYDVVSILHISPQENSGLKTAKGALKGYGANLFDAFTSLLDDSQKIRFRSVETKWCFNVFADREDANWYRWLCDRYPTLTP